MSNSLVIPLCNYSAIFVPDAQELYQLFLDSPAIRRNSKSGLAIRIYREKLVVLIGLREVQTDKNNKELFSYFEFL